MNLMAPTPEPPYYAVLFTSLRTSADDDEYNRTAERMIELAAAQPGFLGVEHARSADGMGITISYWGSVENIRSWQQNAEHLQAQANGRTKWYERYHLRVCRVERAYEFSAE